MEIDKNKLLQLGDDYEVSFSLVMHYYTLLMDIPCVQRGGEDRFLECLETLIQSRITAEFKDEEQETIKNGYDEYMSFEYSLSDALYRIYEDEALDYLCDEYKEQHELTGMEL